MCCARKKHVAVSSANENNQQAKNGEIAATLHELAAAQPKNQFPMRKTLADLVCEVI